MINIVSPFMVRTVYVNTLGLLCMTLYLLCINMNFVSFDFDNKRFKTYIILWYKYTRKFVNGNQRTCFHLKKKTNKPKTQNFGFVKIKSENHYVNCKQYHNFYLL